MRTLERTYSSLGLGSIYGGSGGPRLEAAPSLRSSPAGGAVCAELTTRGSKLPAPRAFGLQPASSTPRVLRPGIRAFVTAATRVLYGLPRPQDPRGTRSFPQGNRATHSLATLNYPT